MHEIVSLNFSLRGPLPLVPQGAAEGKEGAENFPREVAQAGEGKEESEEDDKFFDAVEVSNNDWIKSKSVSFKPTGVEVMGDVGGVEGGKGEEGEGEGEGKQKLGHKRTTSAISVNEAQLLLSSPEPDQLPVCPERTMSVSVVFLPTIIYPLPTHPPTHSLISN